MNLFVLCQKIMPKQLFTALAGRFAVVQWPPFKNLIINLFIGSYQVNMSEAVLKNAEDFADFNDFFTRELQPSARLIAKAEDALVCPADGRISEMGSITQGQILQAKGIDYSVEALLGDAELAKSLEGGQFATVYLSPKDYHRVHMPISGQSKVVRHIPGNLFSVNQTTAQNLTSLFSNNERAVVEFEHQGQPFAVVLVGAMIVGGMQTVLSGKLTRSDEIKVSTVSAELNKGAELGRFYLGSTAIMLFPKQMDVRFKNNLGAGVAVCMGQAMATFKTSVNEPEQTAAQI